MSISLPPIDVLYEDSEVVIINKPHTLPSAGELSCETWFKQRQLKVRGGLLHRLDNGTSGALAFAKTDDAFDHYRSLWRKPGAITKIYRAITPLGTLVGPAPTRPITYPIGHSAKSARRMIGLKNLDSVAIRSIRGKPLDTWTQILNTINGTRPDAMQTQDLTLEIRTGVRHQIRVHLAMLGLPILGDALYAGPPAGRLYLHAWKLKLAELPLVIAPLPEGWET